jgi:hypothetical protein
MALLTLQEVLAARKEINLRSAGEIELETSRRWAARAVAAYEDAGSRCDVERLGEAVGYHQEAIEHGASVSAEWLGKLAAELAGIRDLTYELFERSLLVGDEPTEEGSE